MGGGTVVPTTRETRDDWSTHVHQHHNRRAPTGTDSFAALRIQIQGRVTTPAYGDWDEVRAAWNLHVDQRPAAVVQAADPSDAGVKVREVQAALLGTGLSLLAGSNGDPSVVGYTLGGGLSWFGRRYGLAANHVRALDVVRPDGEPARVTAQSDPDLFWALPGGGGDYAIVTVMEIGLVEAPHIHGGRLMWPQERAGE